MKDIYVAYKSMLIQNSDKKNGNTIIELFFVVVVVYFGIGRDITCRFKKYMAISHQHGLSNYHRIWDFDVRSILTTTKNVS